METLEAISKRRSIRKFKKTLIEEDIIDKLLQAAMSAPSAVNRKPWEFYVVKSPAVQESIRHAMPFGRYKCPLIIVVAGNSGHFLPLQAKNYWIEDCSAAIENILVAATDQGLGAVWCGCWPIEARVKKVRKALEADKKIIPLGVIYLGYPDESKDEHQGYDNSKVHIA